MRLGTVSGLGLLSYDANLYEFYVASSLASYEEVRAFDDAARIQWAAPEQRDWFRKLNADDLLACNRRALAARGRSFMDESYMTPEEQVRAHAKRDDSILAGKIVDADPALVRAVADALEQQGLVGQGGTAASSAAGSNPVAGMVYPEGMEELAQLQRQEGRKMTVMEHYLMRKILKNDDKAKAKREKRADAAERAVVEDAEREEQELKRHAKVSKGQKRIERKEAAEEAALRRRSGQ